VAPPKQKRYASRTVFVLEAPLTNQPALCALRRTESGSHSPLGDRQARLPGVECANIRRRRNTGWRIAYRFCFGDTTHESARALCAKAHRIRFAYPARRSGCLHTRRRGWVYSPKAKCRELCAKFLAIRPEVCYNMKNQKGGGFDE